MTKLKGIMAYGTMKDREMLTVLSRLSNMSNSEWIIDMIRTKYAAAFGQTPPNIIP